MPPLPVLIIFFLCRNYSFLCVAITHYFYATMTQKAQNFSVASKFFILVKEFKAIKNRARNFGNYG
jgi:hypothetical protein